MVRTKYVRYVLYTAVLMCWWEALISQNIEGSVVNIILVAFCEQMAGNSCSHCTKKFILNYPWPCYLMYENLSQCISEPPFFFVTMNLCAYVVCWFSFILHTGWVWWGKWQNMLQTGITPDKTSVICLHWSISVIKGKLMCHWIARLVPW